MNFFLKYILFLFKIITKMLLLVIILFIFFSFLLKKRENKKLILKDIGKKYISIYREIKLFKLNKLEKNILKKKYKQIDKINEKNKLTSCLYVIDFKGDIYANEVESLRDEISAILSVAKKKDEVLLRLESNGGTVNGYGLAAKQLQRIRDKGIFLTISVDKLAVSGGYMMACVANKILSTPFAIIGSIGVIAQIPNFNKLLKKNNIDMEIYTAGKYKRTLTLFGKISEEGREKFKKELKNTHNLFKKFIKKMRPKINIELVSTGEYWYGKQALNLNLIDEINTSDDFIINKIKNNIKVINIKINKKKSIIKFLSTKIMYNIFKIF